jgi:hypothetical protein
MVQLTKGQIAELNNATPGARNAKLGTVISKLLGLSGINLEAGVGTVGTHFAVIDECEVLPTNVQSDNTKLKASVVTDRILRN